jgi:hypothetical protein
MRHSERLIELKFDLAFLLKANCKVCIAQSITLENIISELFFMHYFFAHYSYAFVLLYFRMGNVSSESAAQI